MKISGIISRLIFIVIFLIGSLILRAQHSTDGVFTFKTWFFLERQNEQFNHGNRFDIKNDSLFRFFDSVIDLRVDTLKSKGFSNNFVFLSIALLKNDKPFRNNAIAYKDYVTKQDREVQIAIPVNNCDGYVLCINNNSGRSYRIKGFYGNDFLSMLREIKDEFDIKTINVEQRKKLSTDRFLSGYLVEGVDFKCLYEGLVSGEMNSKKYPCLLNCRNSSVVVH